MAQGEDVVRNPAGIGVMEVRPQDGVVGQQARENVEGFVFAAGNHLVREGAELVRSVRVNRYCLSVVAKITRTKRSHQGALPHGETLPIGRRPAPATPN